MNTSSPSTSLTLLGQLLQPNAGGAWERFHQLYHPLLLAWARRNKFQDADAADLAQEVLLKLTKALPQYTRDGDGSFRGWLYRITANAGHDFRRNRATRALPGANGLSDAGAEPLSEFEELDYRRGLVHRGLELIRPEFGEQTWAAFQLLMVQGLAATDVAAQVGITANAVYLARHRVLTRLRREIDGLLD